MVAAAVSKMKDCKAQGTSDIVPEMLGASSEISTSLLYNLANYIIAEKVPSKKVTSSICSKTKVTLLIQGTTEA